MSEKYGIQEIQDCINYAKAVLIKLTEAKQDDGTIDMAEVIHAFSATAPEAVKAAFGAWDIKKEAQDLSDAEKKILLDEALKIVLLVAGLVVPTIPTGE